MAEQKVVFFSFGFVGLKFLLWDGSELRALAEMTVSLSHKRLGQSAFNTLVFETQQDMLPDEFFFLFFQFSIV